MLRNGSTFNILRIRHAAHISVRYTQIYIYVDIYILLWLSLYVMCVFNATAVEANGKSDTKRLQQRQTQRQRQSMKWAGRGKPPCKCITHVTHTLVQTLDTLAHINISFCSPWAAYLVSFNHWREISS